MVGVEGSPVPVAAAPAGQPGEKKALPRIVVGVDGSPASVEALRWAARQADLTGAAVEAVISWDYPSTSGMEFGSLDIDWAGNARAALADALHVALGNDASRVTQAVTRGHPAEVLVAAAQGADLLVVGSRGHVALPGRLLGSVSEHVAARASCPVVVVRHVPDPIALGQRTHLSGREVAVRGGFPMKLSQHEQQILDEIEQGVRAEDPEFFANMTGSQCRRGGVVRGSVTFLSGLVAFMVGAVLAQAAPGWGVVVSLVGFLAMFWGCGCSARVTGRSPNTGRKARRVSGSAGSGTA